MPIDVNNNIAQTATIIITADNKLTYSDQALTSGMEAIGAPGAVSSELAALIGGGALDYTNVLQIFAELTSGAGASNKGPIAGIFNVALVALDDDAFTLTFTNKNNGKVDTLSFTGAGVSNVYGSNDTLADLNDAKSRFSVIDTGSEIGGALGAANAIIGTKPINDLIGGQLNVGGENADIAKILTAALMGDPRLELLGLDGSSFSVRVNNVAKGTSDTLLFKGADVEAIIPAAIQAGLQKLTVATVLDAEDPTPENNDVTEPQQDGPSTPVDNSTDRFAAFIDADKDGMWDVGEQKENLAKFGNATLVTDEDVAGGLIDLFTSPGGPSGNQFFLGVAGNSNPNFNGSDALTLSLKGGREALGTEVTIRGAQGPNPQNNPLNDIAAGTSFDLVLFNDLDNDGVADAGEVVRTQNYTLDSADESFTVFLTDEDLATFDSVQIVAKSGQFSLDSVDFFFG